MRLGQGYRIIGTISGPTAIDDVLVAWLTSSSTGLIACLATSPLLGANTFDLAFDELMLPGYGGVADNATLTLQLEARDSGGSMYDSQAYSAAYVHDPTGGIGSLIMRKIYSQVHHDFPRTA